jgi:hypothetical protein
VDSVGRRVSAFIPSGSKLVCSLSYGAEDRVTDRPSCLCIYRPDLFCSTVPDTLELEIVSAEEDSSRSTDGAWYDVGISHWPMEFILLIPHSAFVFAILRAKSLSLGLSDTTCQYHKLHWSRN